MFSGFMSSIAAAVTSQPNPSLGQPPTMDQPLKRTTARSASIPSNTQQVVPEAPPTIDICFANLSTDQLREVILKRIKVQDRVCLEAEVNGDQLVVTVPGFVSHSLITFEIAKIPSGSRLRLIDENICVEHKLLRNLAVNQLNDELRKIADILSAATI